MEIETASLPHVPDVIETRRIFDDLMKSFEEFKRANDERLAVIEKRQSADVLLEEKVDRINNHLSGLNTSLQRPPLDNNTDTQGQDTEIRAAFMDYIRTGNTTRLQEAKSTSPDLTTTTDGDGAHLVPNMLHIDLEHRIAKNSVLRKLARVQTLSVGDHLDYVYPKRDFAANWLQQRNVRPQTTSSDFSENRVHLREVYALVRATPQFLDDPAVDTESWIFNSMAHAFTESENQAFVAGVGSEKPVGLTLKSSSNVYNILNDVVFSKKTGNDDGLPTADVPEFLMDFAFGLESRYRPNSVWLMNSATQAALRKIKDSDGHYIWNMGLGGGFTPTLLGHTVYEEAHMPDMAEGKKPIAFGDFHEAYLIVQRDHTRLLRDPYSSKPFVSFYATRRIGGDAVNSRAYRLVEVKE